MGAFRYDKSIMERFPTTAGVVIHATDLTNGPSDDSLRETFRLEQEQVKQNIGDTPLSEISSLAAWRRTFTAFGVKPTQYRSAPEALLRRLTKQGEIPSINQLVDVANLVSIRHRLAVAVFDHSNVTGVTTVRFADGDEKFTDLGSGSESPPEPGEVIFVDEKKLVSARRWCWRQSVQSAASPTTVEAMITIESQHEGGHEDVSRALDDMASLLARYQPEASVQLELLSANHRESAF